MDEIMQKAQTVFQKVFDDPELNIRREMTAGDIENWDSLTHIQLIIGLEQGFKIKLKASEILSAKNVGDLLDLIAKRNPQI
jgi:acyl carrier protein